jgi:DNA-binding CsgD family transcriptional regulator
VLVSAILIFSEKEFDRLFSSVFERELNFDDLKTQKGIPAHHDDTNGEPHARPYIEACKRVGASFRLSSREQEIFELLALGRGSDSIASRLHISMNTARTHTHNIYAKLNVHSRNELFALVETAWKDEK